MKDLTFEEFAGNGIHQIAHIFQEAIDGNEVYRIKTWKTGNFIIMSEADYNVQHDALRMLLQNAATIPRDWIKKFEPTMEENKDIK